MSVVQVRGTSGSGKSTAVRRFMETMEWESEYVTGRKRPLYYRSVDVDLPQVVVLGHYESACGGCDTIGSAAKVYDLTVKLLADVPNVLIIQEGLLLSEDVKWTSRLPAVRVLYLSTPVDRCVEQIKGRRAAAGNDKPLSEMNTRNRVAVIDRSRIKLTAAGVRCYGCSADQAVDLLRKSFQLHAERKGV